MTELSLQMNSYDPQILPRRLGEFIRQRATAKDVVRLVGCDIRTAENIRRGLTFPLARHWIGLIATFGEDLTEAVFHPEKAAARLEREVSDLEAQLAKKRADLGVVQGGSSRVAQVSARREDDIAAPACSPPRRTSPRP